MELNRNNMELIIKPYSGLPCELEIFTINGKYADSEDFGDIYDHNTELAGPYSCGNKCFDPKLSTKEVLDKYHLTEEEYNTICNKLEDKLCVGSCGLCI